MHFKHPTLMPKASSESPVTHMCMPFERVSKQAHGERATSTEKSFRFSPVWKIGLGLVHKPGGSSLLQLHHAQVKNAPLY